MCIRDSITTLPEFMGRRFGQSTRNILAWYTIVPCLLYTSRRTYKNIPFYLSSRMYGTFYHTYAHSKLSLAGQSTRSVQFLSDQAMLDVFIIAGNTMEERCV